MLVVGDSSVFINFAVIGEFECLKSLSPIYIPDKVYEEVYSNGKYRPGSDEIYNAVQDGWIIVRTYTDNNLYAKLDHLHEGERQALALAYDLNANLILLDDRAAVLEYKVYLRGNGVKRLGTKALCKKMYIDGIINVDPNTIELKLLEWALKNNQI